MLRIRDSCVRGYHIYRSIWDPSLGETYPCERELDNEYDKFAVAVKRDSTIVGHIPIKISQPVSIFLTKEGSTVSCEVTGYSRYSFDLPQGGEEIPANYICNGRKEDIAELKAMIKEITGDHFDTRNEECQQALLEAIRKNGSLSATFIQCMPFGPPGVGKTALYHRLIDKEPPGTPASRDSCGSGTPSTDILEPPKMINITMQLSELPSQVLTAGNGTWHETEGFNEQVNSWLKTVELHVSQQNTGSGSFSEEATDGSFSEEATDGSFSSAAQTSSSYDFVTEALDSQDIDTIHPLNNSSVIFYTDTGGQPEFQEVLPALVAGPMMFLLVFNLSCGLEKPYDVIYRSQYEEKKVYESLFTVKEIFMECLASIASYRSGVAKRDSLTTPPISVLTLGTHKDLVKEEDIQKCNKTLKDAIENTSLYKENVIEYNDPPDQLIIPVDNYAADKNDVTLVRNVIERVIKRAPNQFSVTFPVTWLFFQLFLISLKQSTISYSECETKAKEFNILPKDLFNCLFFLHHKVGTIRYYDQIKELKDIVIIKPGIIFKAITNLITSTFNIENVGSFELTAFQQYGLFKNETINKLLETKEISSSMFIALLKYLHILGPSHNIPYGDYFLPCALRHAPEPPALLNSKPMLISFKDGFIPKGVFSSILAVLCQKDWNIQCINRRPQLYRNQVSFYVGHDGYSVIIKDAAKFLEVYVTSDLEETNTSDENEFCQNIKAVLHAGLKQVCSILKYDESFMNPQFGFYCQEGTCKNNEQKHIALIQHFQDSVVAVCEISNRRFGIEKLPQELTKWFQLDLVINEGVANRKRSQDANSDVSHSKRTCNDTSMGTFDEFCDINQYGKPAMKDLLNWVVAKIPSQWKSFGTSLGFANGVLEGIQVDTSCGGDPKKMFHRLLENWENNPPSPYNWGTLLNILVSPILKQNRLAKDIAEKLRSGSLNSL